MIWAQQICRPSAPYNDIVNEFLNHLNWTIHGTCMPFHGSLSNVPAPIPVPSQFSIAAIILMNGPNLAYIVPCMLFYMSDLRTEIGICLCRSFRFFRVRISNYIQKIFTSPGGC
jgi:hypothetical protein